MNEYIVYKHTTPSGKVYIGITRTTLERRCGSNGRNYSKNILFYRAIQKYGWQNIKHEILFDGLTKEQATTKGKTAQRNHLQQTENEIICGQAQVSPLRSSSESALFNRDLFFKCSILLKSSFTVLSSISYLSSFNLSIAILPFSF